MAAIACVLKFFPFVVTIVLVLVLVVDFVGLVVAVEVGTDVVTGATEAEGTEALTGCEEFPGKDIVTSLFGTDVAGRTRIGMSVADGIGAAVCVWFLSLAS